MSKAGKQRIAEYLEHIVEAIARIEKYVSDIDEVVFLADEKTQDAVIRNFEIIGEACNNISKHYPEYAMKHADIPWGFAYEMRNALAHGYFAVDLEIVWRTTTSELPKLATNIGKLIKAGVE